MMVRVGSVGIVLRIVFGERFDGDRGKQKQGRKQVFRFAKDHNLQRMGFWGSTYTG
jgi:hypothetical protein